MKFDQLIFFTYIGIFYSDGGELNHEKHVVGHAFLTLVNYFDFAECETIQPVHLLDLSVAMLLGQLAEALHLRFGGLFALAGRLAGEIAVTLDAQPDAQIIHALAEHAVLAEHGDRCATNDCRLSSTRAVKDC